MKVNNEQIGQRIRNGRKNLKLTREEFSEIIGLSDFYIGQLERGERQMSLPAMVKIAGCLHISLDYLIFGRNECNHYLVKDTCNYYVSDPKRNTLLNELCQLLGKCSPKELVLIKKMVETILPYIDS